MDGVKGYIIFHKQTEYNVDPEQAALTRSGSALFAKIKCVSMR